MRIPEPSENGKKSKKRGTEKGLPEPDSGGDFDPFLKAADIGKEGVTAKITVMGGPEETDSEFSDALLPVKFKGQDYVLGIKWSSGNYARLFKRFGKNPKKWKGTVNVEVKHFKKNDYVAIA